MRQATKNLRRFSLLAFLLLFLANLFSVSAVENPRQPSKASNLPNQPPAKCFPLKRASLSQLTGRHSALAYSSYLGGLGLDAASSVAVDANGFAYLTGYTQSTNFPATPLVSRFDGSKIFVVKFDTANNKLVYARTLPGITLFFLPFHPAIAVDPAGNAYVTGETRSANFPLSKGFQPSLHSLNLNSDAFLTKLDANGSLIFSTYFGGSSSESFLNSARETASAVAIDKFNNAYIVGGTTSTDLPLSNSLQRYGGEGDAFLARIIETESLHPAPSVQSVTPNKGSGAGNTAISISGANFREGAKVSIGGSPATQVQVISPSLIQALTGAQTSLETKVYVTNADGQSGVLNNGFAYLRVPQIMHLFEEKRQLVVVGTDFDRGALLLIDGEIKATLPVLDSYRLVSTKKTLKKLPPLQRVRVQVRNGSGVSSQAMFFERRP
jgi:hypothetical protein